MDFEITFYEPEQSINLLHLVNLLFALEIFGIFLTFHGFVCRVERRKTRGRRKTEKISS